MRLGFDASALRPGGKGIARFQREFLGALSRLDLVEHATVFVPEDGDLAAVPARPEWDVVPVRTRPSLRWELAGLGRAAQRARADVVLTTSERGPLAGPPSVAFVYEHPSHRAARARETGAPFRQQVVDGMTVALFQISARRAACLIAASHSTAADLPRRPGVHVVYSAASAAFSPSAAGAASARAAYDSPKGYFLHLASDDPRENSEVVLDAYARTDRAARPPLVVAGLARRTLPELRERAGRLGIASDVRWAGFVPDERLADLYRGAIAYVDPSLYEGFGMQALEALSCGTPCIASDTTSLPEVIGDAGLLLDPHDVAGFAHALDRIAADPGLRDDLGRRALVQAARFSWERTVRETIEICAEVAGA